MQDIFRTRFIKRFARQALRGKWVRSILLMLIYALIMNGPSFIVSYFTDSTVVAYILSVYRIIIGGPLLMGLTTYYQDCFRGTDEPGLGSFGKGISFGIKAVQLYVFVFVITFLGLVLFIIPGVIAAIRYSQSFFILADDPSLPPVECMRRSRIMMTGLSGRFFSLEISFIGWIFLSAVPSSLVMSNMVDVYNITAPELFEEEIARASSAPPVVLLGLLTYFVFAYVLAANACFYDIISGNLKLYTEVPIDGEAQRFY